MQRPTSFRAVAGSTMLAVVLVSPASPSAADETEELRQQIEALSRKVERLEQRNEQDGQAHEAGAAIENAVTAGEVPGSFKLPGTNTSMRIAGYVGTTFIYDIGPRPTSRGGDIASAHSAILETEPAYENRGEARISARSSRFNLSTFTPTRFGRLRTFIEGDFTGPPNDKGSRATTNGTLFKMRHAYGELGSIVMGQYWSNFSDNSVFPNKVNGTGPVGRAFLRQAQIRHTHRLGSGRRFAVALETPRGDFHDAGDHNLADGYPDLTAHYRHEVDRWHVQVAGMLRRIGINEGIAGGARDSATSWALNQSAAFHLPGSENRISWYFAFGDGIGRYLDGGVDQGASVTADGRLDTQFGYGGFVTYQHWWNGTWQSNADFGVSRFDLNPDERGDANHTLYSSHVNLIWLPLDNMEFGVEYAWAHRKVHDGREGKINRMNAHAVFYF